MKKSVIFLTALLLATIAGTYAVYELYVKQRMKELGEHIAQEKALAARISVLETTFSKAEPDIVLEQWRKSTQPWSDAVNSRSSFFSFGDFDKEVEIPEDAIPKIYYRQELPKRIKNLEDYAADKQVTVADVNCGVPRFDAFGEGSNPPPEEIAGYLKTYDYCSALTKLIIDARPVSIDPLRIWPEITEEARSGAVVKRTTGISMRISTQALVRFMDKLAFEDRYFRVDEFRLSNVDLRQQSDPLLSVEMVLTQANFRPSKKAVVAAATDGEASVAANQRLTALFGARTDSGGPDTEDKKEEPSGWQKFRRQWLPF